MILNIDPNIRQLNVSWPRYIS